MFLHVTCRVQIVFFLRVERFFIRLLESVMFTATLNLVARVELPLFLEHNKINILASNNCFSYRDIFQYGVDTKLKK